MASAKVYDFLWDTYCDWYIELTKTRLNGDDEQAKLTAQNVLCWVLTELLKLLHPFMPFITEEIFQALPHTGDFLMTSQWPKYREDLHFPEEEANLEAVMDTIYDDLAAYVSTVDIEALREELVSYFDSRISQVVSDASFSEEQLDSIADALLANEKVQALIDEAKADAVSEALEQYAQNNRQRIVSVPDFSASPIVTTDSDYQAVREAERQAAIQSLLGKMGQ